MKYGFYGIFDRHDDPDAALALARAAIAKETGCTAECSKNFLESYQGRLFAEGVSKLMSENALSTAAAIDGAVAKLRRHTISSKDESDYGIQTGLPYLKGFCNGKLKADTGEDWPLYTNPFV
jgi:hypothetical protein